jgi:iron complex transport system substrate-binding protein
MNKVIFILLSFTFFFISCKKENSSVSKKFFVDEIGNRVELNSTPTKIISAAPNITEIIYALGAGDLLVGRTTFCNYPPEVEKVQVVGDMLNLNFEKILEMKPDILFLTVEGNTKETYEKLKSLNIAVYVINPRNIGGILKSISNIAEVLSKKKAGDSLIHSIKERLNLIEQLNLKTHTAMFVVSLHPLMIAGQNTFISDILKKVKLENIAPQSISSYPLISREEVLQKNPEWIILPSGYSLEEVLKQYSEWKNLVAIKKNKILFIDPDLFFRPGPRFIDAIEFLAENLRKDDLKR